MAFRIDKAVLRGEISNEERGKVTGKIWLAGRSEPLELELSGNCLRDLAGCRLAFSQKEPVEEVQLNVLSLKQTGVTGEMTASRKVRVPTVSDDEAMLLMEKQETVPSRLANGLYLEWYSEENGRVLIESINFDLQVSVPAWPMTANEEQEQLAQSQQHFRGFIGIIIGEDFARSGDDGEEVDDEEESLDAAEVENTASELPAVEQVGEPLDEFEWEQELRDADRRAEAYQEAFEKYKDHPQRERLIAEALGWDDDESDDEDEIFENDEEESENWSDENEADAEPHHPLSQRAMDFALTLQREAEERGLMSDNADLRDNRVLGLILHIISLGGKLAGALDGWAQGLDPEPGFIIAMLKRAQVPLNEALQAFDVIDAGSLSEETRQWLQTRKRDLFDLRKDIIDLMHQLRAS